MPSAPPKPSARVRAASRRMMITLALSTAVSIACTDAPNAPAPAMPRADITVGPAPGGGLPASSPWVAQTLGVLPGKGGSRANDISDNGIVVGESFAMIGDYSAGLDRPFYWTEATGMRPLPIGSGASRGYALAISDNGLYAVGYVVTAVEKVPVRWKVSLYQGGTSRQDLPLCGYFNAGGRALGVNDAGVVVGETDIGGHDAEWEAAVWEEPDRCPEIIAFTGTEMDVARDITNGGRIVGAGFDPRRGFITNTVASTLQPLASNLWSDVHAVNELGEIAGVSWGSGPYTAVYRSPITAVTVAHLQRRDAEGHHDAHLPAAAARCECLRRHRGHGEREGDTLQEICLRLTSPARDSARPLWTQAGINDEG